MTDAGDWEELEKGAVRSRRDRNAQAGWDAPPAGYVGLALSGGGIRSATFSLGVLRSLSRLQLIHKVDYLSTVSGGGYVGSFFCSLFVPDQHRGGASGGPGSSQGLTAALGPDPLGSADGQDALERLRQSGRYLAPSGARDLIYAFGILARNWVAIHIVIGVTALALVMLLNLLRDRLGTAVPAAMEPGLSPLVWTLIPAGVTIASLSWAYWLTKRDFLPVGWLRYVGVWSLINIGIAVACFVALRNEAASEGARYWLLGLVMFAAVGAILLHLAAETLTGLPARGAEQTALVAEEDRVRHRLSRWLSYALAVTIVLALLAALDTLALLGWGANFREVLAFLLPEELETAIGPSEQATGLAAIGAVVAAVVPLLRKLVASLASGDGTDQAGGLRRFFARFGMALVLPLALLLLTAEILGWSILGHYLSFETGTGKKMVLRDGFWWWFVGLWFATAAMAISYSFINLSSLATFYGGRLRRAYLGATNRGRRRKNVPVTVGHPNDEIGLREYYGTAAGAPVHLINVTINETKNRYSNLVQRDRKGKPLVVSPAGYLFPEASQTDVRRIPLTGEAEALPLSAWVGISGAAFSTGAGSNTTIAQAIIAGLANVRLGYWWSKRRVSKQWYPAKLGDLMQVYLFREFRAAYEGTATARLYLSDGGHFENTGAYELIRRKVPFIAICDNGCDPSYQFDDLANLMRKARIDFRAEISFLGDAELTSVLGSNSPLRSAIGTLQELADPDRSQAGPVAALADITYATGEAGRLLLIKPRLSGDGPHDLLRYAQLNTDFPQQTTLDQFFDEAQWESYYLLGQRIADMLFDSSRYGTAAPWGPWQLS